MFGYMSKLVQPGSIPRRVKNKMFLFHRTKTGMIYDTIKKDLTFFFSVPVCVHGGVCMEIWVWVNYAF